MNAKISVFVICVETIIYLLLYNLHNCTFKYKKIFENSKWYFCQITWAIQKLYFKNHFKYKGTSISIIILWVVLHIYSESILLLYQHINWSATIYLFKLITITTDQLLVISLVKVNYTVLFWRYGNEFEHCQ